MTTPGGELLGEARIEVDADTDPAIRALRRFSRDAERQLRSVSDSAEGASRGLGPISSVLGRISLGVGALGVGAGSALPLLAGIVTTLQNIAPAGAVAVSGMLAVQQATATIRLGMLGVGDAITSAFDTSEAGTEKFEKSLERLSPAAREFAVAVREIGPAFQQGIQEELFFGFADALTALSTSVLPVLQTNLTTTAKTLNGMALDAAQAAGVLATNGTLGVAMEGANTGLSNLATIPAQVVTALGQLAAAGAPTFDKLTASAANAATKISERLGAAFKSGELTDSINFAIDVIVDLGGIAGDVFGTLRNILGAASTEGEGTFTVLAQIASVLREATGTEGFQDAIGALVETMGVLGTTVGPLLSQALAAIGPVFVALAGPAQTLIAALGEGLSPIIDALGPVLEVAAEAVGALVTSLAPLLPVVGNLIAALLPPLVPLINVIGQLFTDLAPIITQVGQILAAVLAPVIAALPAILAPFIGMIREVSAAVLPLASQLLTAMTPALISMGKSIAALAVALAPLLVLIARLAALTLSRLTPILTPLIGLIGRLAAVFQGVLSRVIRSVVIPAINAVTALLRGDLPATSRAASAAISGFGNIFRSVFNAFQRVVTNATRNVVVTLRGLGGRARSAVSNLGSTLFSSGRSLIQGFINGMLDKLSGIRAAASSLVDAAGKYFPGSPAEEGRFSGRGWTLYSGQATADAFAEGLLDRLSSTVRVSDQFTSATASALPGALPVGTARTPTAATGTAVVNNFFTVNLTNAGVLGSRPEVLDFLSTSLDRLARTGRLPAALTGGA